MQISKDMLWKGILEDLFEDFLLYFYPEWTQENIDFDRPFEFLDKELDLIYPNSKEKKRFADKLVKVYLKSGEEQWLLVHVEVQGYADASFSERMFTYFYRIRDLYLKDIVALAILSDDQADFHPKGYHYAYLDTSLDYQFQSFKISAKTEAELDKPGNPFSIVMLTVYKALQKGELQDEKQYIWKITLIRKLLAAGYSDEKIRHILKFLRYYVDLSSETFTQKLEEEISTLTKNRRSMGIEEAILYDVRQQGKEEGKMEGKIEGQQEKSFEAVRNMLKRNFSDEDIKDILQVDQAFVDQVRASLSKQ